MPTSKKPAKATFPPTQWSKVLAARQGSGSGQAALAEAYWQPLRDFLCASGLRRDDAMDLVQDFICYALQSGLFLKADPDRGRFRSFLLCSLLHFAANQRRGRMAGKRHPKGGFASLDDEVAPYYHPPTLWDTETPERQLGVV